MVEKRVKAIWISKDDMKDNTFMELAKGDPYLSYPLHRFEGNLKITEDELELLGDDLISNGKSYFYIRRSLIVESYLGFDKFYTSPDALKEEINEDIQSEDAEQSQKISEKMELTDDDLLEVSEVLQLERENEEKDNVSKGSEQSLKEKKDGDLKKNKPEDPNGDSEDHLSLPPPIRVMFRDQSNTKLIYLYIEYNPEANSSQNNDYFKDLYNPHPPVV